MREKVPPIMAYIMNNHVDVALIQESWIRKCDGKVLTEVREYDGYDIITYRKPVKLEWGGGVAVIFRKDLKLNRIKSNTVYKTFEHLTCKLITEKGPILIITIYRRGYSQTNKFTLKQFIPEFTLFLDEVCDASTPILISGDINIHVELASTDIQSLSASAVSNITDINDFLCKLDEYGLKQVVTEPTHDLGGTLDLAIMSKLSPISSDVTVGLKNQVCKSDHYHIFVKIPIKPLTTSNKVTLLRREMDNLKSPLFMDKLLNLKLKDKIECCTDVNDAVGTYNKFLGNLFDEVCPVKEITITSHRKQKWYNIELREMKQTCRQAERKYKKNPSSINHNELINTRNLYRICVKQTRTAFFSNLFESISDDIGLVYKTANYFTGDSNTRRLPSCNDDVTLANEFADFFIEKVDIIRSEIENDPTVDWQMRHSLHTGFNHEDGLSSFNLLSEDDVIKLVGQMPCKLNSFDPIPLSFVKEHVSCFSASLHAIVNQSLQSGIFPDGLKHGSISPILKSPSDDHEIHKNFRPVTTLTFLSKFLEKAASSQIVTYLERKSLIPHYQSAYLKSHSCETALFKFTNDVQQKLSENKAVILVQLDLSAAFDTVDHAVLLDLLHHKFGISGTVLKWLTSYLNGRSFSVKIGSVNGRTVLLIYGVPQGSILGPLLFILYTSDLPAIALKSDVDFQSYADDSHLFASFDPESEYEDTMDRVNKCLKDIERWMKSVFLKMNVGKTEVLFIAKPRIHSLFRNMSITIADKCYVSSSNKSVKSLGAYFNGTMSVNNMVSELVKSCNFNLKKMAGFRYILSTKQKLLLVKSHILCKVDYCSVLLANAPAYQVNRLQKLINKGIRFAHSLKKRDHVSNHLKEAHFLPMSFRIQYKCCLFIYNMLHGICPHYMNNVIIPRLPQERNLRSNSDNLLFYQTSHHTTLQYGMINNWNCLPYSIRCIPTRELFKKHLKTHYFSIAFT